LTLDSGPTYVAEEVLTLEAVPLGEDNQKVDVMAVEEDIRN
jgi:hypothetical protein